MKKNIIISSLVLMALTLLSCDNKYKIESGEYDTVAIPVMDENGEYNDRAIKREFMNAELIVRGGVMGEVIINFFNGKSISREGEIDNKGHFILSNYNMETKESTFDTLPLVKKDKYVSLIDEKNVIFPTFRELMSIFPNTDSTVHHVEYLFVKKGE